MRATRARARSRRTSSRSRTTTACTRPGSSGASAERFAVTAALDGVTGRAVDVDGRSSASWQTGPARARRDNLWNRAISFTIFLRRSVVQPVGGVRRAARPRLGDAVALGRGDRLPRPGGATRARGSSTTRTLIVRHDVREDDARRSASETARASATSSRKHGYPAASSAGCSCVRSAARSRALAAARRLRRPLPARHAPRTVRGYLGARPSKISA